MKNSGTHIAALTGPCFPYVVKKGDCLSAIAQRYHTTVAILAEINHIRNVNIIYAGSTILIPSR